MSNPFQVVRDFEAALCDYTGAKYAVTTTSCTAALMLAVAWHLRDQLRLSWTSKFDDGDRHGRSPEIEIPKRTYIGVPYAIREAGGYVVFRDETWVGAYDLRPLPVWDSARYFTSGLYRGEIAGSRPGFRMNRDCSGQMVCVSFHWSKTLGIQQGGAILHDNPEADAWLRRARFDGRAEGVPPKDDTFPLSRAWHAYMSPEVAAEGLMRLSLLPKHNDPLPWGPGTSSDYPDLSEVFK